ncbi:AmiS/UreI family transporter [Geodermatophilus sp. URMC 64]
MGPVGLLYVGPVLIVNGLMLLGRVDARAAAPLNLFVGALQVVTPTVLILTSGGDPDVILFAAGIYLFGFTYLYVGINLLAGLDGTGLGWFSAFVACAAVTYSLLNFFFANPLFDNGFGVIWLYWAVLWGLFWVVLGLGREEYGRYTGAIAVVAGVFTCAVPAFLILTGSWTTNVNTWAVVLAIVEVGSLVALSPLLRARAAVTPETSEFAEGVPEGMPLPRTAADQQRYGSESGSR